MTRMLGRYEGSLHARTFGSHNIYFIAARSLSPLLTNHSRSEDFVDSRDVGVLTSGQTLTRKSRDNPKSLVPLTRLIRALRARSAHGAPSVFNYREQSAWKSSVAMNDLPDIPR